MPNPAKLAQCEDLKACIDRSHIVVLTSYIGINAEQATELRNKLRAERVQFKVFKNTLARRVLDELGLSEAAVYLDGPTAWAFSDDPVAPARVLKDFAKEIKVVRMNGGILDGRVVSREQLDALATLPPREVLLALVVGTIAMPLRSLVGVLQAVPRKLVLVLDAIRKQKEEGGAAAA